jgi:hypothetical protein
MYRGVVALVIAWALASLSWPFGWDQGILAWVGDVISRGGMPYRDAWDIKGPLPFYMYAFAQWLFGRNLWGIRILDLGFLVAATAMLTRFVVSLTSRRVGRWTAVVFVLWYASGSFWNTAQPDGWVGMFMILGLIPLVMNNPRASLPQLGVAGLLVGCSTLVKPLYMGFLLVLFVYVLASGRLNWRRRTSAFLTVGIFFVLPLALTFAWFRQRGAWADLVDVFLLYPVQNYARLGSLSVMSRLRGIVQYILGGRVAVVLLPAVGVGTLALWREAKRTALLLLAWVVIALSGVALQGRFFDYHWIPIFPPLAVIAAVGFQAALGQFPDASVQRIAKLTMLGHTFIYFAFATVLFHAGVHPLLEVAHWLRYVSGQGSAEEYYGHFGIPGADIRAADYIRERTTEGDKVLVWGWNSSIIYLSGRQTPGRFGFSMPLLTGEGTARRAAYQQEFMTSLRKTPPVYIVDAPQSVVLLGGQYGRRDFPDFDEFVSTRYRREKQFGDLMLYRLADGPSHP